MIIYTDGVFDLHHWGHGKLFEKIKLKFPNSFLIVGVHTDENTKLFKSHPVMSQDERLKAISYNKYVNKVIISKEWIITKKFIDDNNIDLVCRDGTPYPCGDTNDTYSNVKSMGKFYNISYTSDISTSDIIQRILNKYDYYTERNAKRNIFQLSPILSDDDIYQLKKSQKKMTTMFTEFDKICKKYDLKYWCKGGTMIGSIRHNGWIPWDGDIDIGMLDEDAIILNEKRNEFSKDIFFQTSDTDKNFTESGIYKLRLLNSQYKNSSDSSKCLQGLQLDIFIHKKNENIVSPIVSWRFGDLYEYEYDEIFPLREGRFENITVYLPNKFEKICLDKWEAFPPKIPAINDRFPHEGNPITGTPRDEDLLEYPELFDNLQQILSVNLNCFQFWDSGINGMPPMIRYIYDHNLNQSEKFNFNLVLINDENVKEYFKPHPRFFDLASNFKSDIVRFNVLDKYGGLWLDSDIIIIKDLNVLYNNFLTSNYDIVVDVEHNNALGCASLVMLKNSLSSNFCLNYVNNYLDSDKSLKWGEIGPGTINNLVKELPTRVKINDSSVTSKGCNFISWKDNPGVDKSKWIMSPSKVSEKTHELLSNPDCYYAITWTIYRKNNIQGDIVDFVFNNPNSVFTHLIKEIPTFNILIATVGRPTLQNMLNSLSSQLWEDDCLTVVFDGHSNIPLMFDFTNFKCKVNLFYEPIALGYWGHGIRNKYANLLEKRDFIMHADDDDTYTDGIFNTIRSYILDINTLYVYKFEWQNKPWPSKHDNCREGTIGTPLGVIPYELNKKGTWLPRFGGDGKFYEEIARHAKNIVFSDIVIYKIKPYNKENNYNYKKDPVIYNTKPYNKENNYNYKKDPVPSIRFGFKSNVVFRTKIKNNNYQEDIVRLAMLGFKINS